MSDDRVSFGIQTVVPAEVEDATVVEALDRVFEARVEISVADLDQSPEAFLGQDAVLSWGRADYRRQLAGLVRAVRTRGGFDDRAYFELEIAPALALLALTRNTRMFQSQSVPDILRTVLEERLGPYGREVQLDLNADYPVREYCVQYQESDLDFVQRLMQEEGISYAFDHQAGVELLVLRDDNAAHPRVPNAVDPVPYAATLGDGAFAEEVIFDLDRAHDTTVTAVAIRDFDFSTPGFTVEDETGGEDALGRRRESYQHGWGRGVTIGDYDEGAARYQARDTPRQKELRLESAKARAVVGHGKSRVVGFVPGTTFEIAGHPGVGVDGEYLLTAVTHRSEGTGGGESEGYHNVFECIPLSTPHRPRRTAPKPRISSIQTAIVTGPAGEEIHTDAHGRIKVQFPWDRENAADEKSSVWVRVQQKWAGAGWGFLWIPRIGMEVVVQFVDGDPDRPLVTGCVYDAEHQPPYELPDERTKSTIRSNSSPGGGGFNEWRFEDRSGEEQVYTHAQRNYDEVVENDHTTDVGNDQTIQVDRHQKQTVHAHQREDVHGDQTLTVGGNRTVHVESDFDETVDGTETRTVSGAVTETFAANETRMVAANLVETLGATEKREIGGGQTETIGGNRSVTIAAGSTETVAASLTETIGGSVTTTAGGNWTVTADGGFTAISAGAITLTMTGGLTLGAPGGVNQVDSILDRIAGTEGWKGALKIETCSFKDETFGAHLSYTGVKTGGVVTEIPNLGFQAELCGLKFWKAPATLKIFGADVDQQAAKSEN